MMKLIFILLFPIILTAQYKQNYIDTVYSYKWGTGQNAGQEPKFFPQNIFGPPDTTAREDFQSADPEQILSLGLGGEIIVGFRNLLITDGPGADFTIFENAFLNPVTNRIFAEPAVVSVSQDGINYYQFPFDSLTLKGCAGITPTHGNMNSMDTMVSGGDKFDLSTIGLKYIKYIKIKDICNLLLNNPSHPFYDPIISGFDLDAVAGLHLVPDNIIADVKEVNEELDFQYINENFRNNICRISSVGGMIMKSEKLNSNLEDLMNELPQGVYFIQFFDGFRLINKKIMRLR